MTEKIRVASLNQIAPGAMLHVEAAGKALVLFHKSDGTFCALQDRCSHADVRLSRGQFDGQVVTCTAHGAKFDVCSGKALCMPAVSAVKSYQVAVEGEEIYILL